MSRPGLFAERTALAWTRSAVAIGGFGALAVRTGLHAHEHVLGFGLAAALVTLAAGTWLRGGVAYRGGDPSRTERDLGLLTAATLAAAAASLVLTVS